MTSGDAAPDGALAHDLRIAVLRLARRIRSNRVDTSLSLSQVSALGVLSAAGPMSAGDLAAVESVQPPTMTKVLSALVQRGLITREADPADKRAVRLAVTAAGQAIVVAERAARDAWLTRALDALPSASLACLAAAVPVLEHVSAGEMFPAPAYPHPGEPQPDVSARAAGAPGGPDHDPGEPDHHPGGTHG